jgi:hypothetical protein
VPEWWRFLDQSLVVGFRALDDLDLSDIGLRRLLGRKASLVR